MKLSSLLVLTSAFVILGNSISARAESAPLVGKRFIAVDNVCAWPNLTLLRDGTIIATIHNQPAHGLREGDVECWASKDGEFWQKAGTPTQHEPNTIRMNHGVGLAKNGDLLVLCSGWSNEQQPGQAKKSSFRDLVLSPWVCRSSDGGRTWKVRKEFPAPEPGVREYIPFGDIFVAEDGSLRTSCYSSVTNIVDGKVTGGFRSWMFRSDDDGETWKQISVIGPQHDETALFHLGGKRWLAAARKDAVYLVRSEDNGATWGEPERVTELKELNGHIIRLADGRLLLSYGNRIPNQFGVMAKWSSDEGKTWSAPVRLAESLHGDCGYPSSVQRADGKIVTAFYSKGSVNHERYHMGVTIWDVPTK